MIEHWQYFLALDDDFGTLSRFIEPTASNYRAYSIEMARLLMTATQECDVVLKQVCANLGDSSASTEGDYRRILGSGPITGVKILLPRFGCDSIPFEAWKRHQTPEWWTANNKVKHERHAQFARANLGNVISAVSGLYVALLYRYPAESAAGKLSPNPEHFRPDLHPQIHTMATAATAFKVPR